MKTVNEEEDRKMSEKIPAIIDCDPGHDDAVALMLAFGCGKLDVLGVTTVAGNGSGRNTYKNALRVLTVIGKRAEVARGADRPLMRPLVTASNVHGQSGLDGPAAVEPVFSGSSRSAFELITQTLLSSDRKIVLIPTGPLTNIAIALLAYPDIKEKIERIVLMGGAAREGNRTPAAEFNIMTDPEAARIVFESGIPITMIGLDATHKALIMPDEVAAIRESGAIGKYMGELMDFYSIFYRSRGFPGNPIHDALAVAAAYQRDIVKTLHLHVDIETGGEFTLGRTVVDFGGVTGKEPNAEVALDVDREKFVAMIADAVRTLEADR